MTVALQSKRRVVFFFLLFLLLICLFYQPTVARGVREGLLLCATVVIPSLFPFLVLGDLLASSGMEMEKTFFQKTFASVFRTQPCGFYAFSVGALCGFPLGAREVCRSYLSGELTKEEARHLLGFVNNTGPAFLIAGIGVGLRGSAVQGMLFYLIQLTAAFLTGFLTAPKKRRDAVVVTENKGVLSFSKSLSGAVSSLFSICGTVTLFSALSTLLLYLLPDTIAMISAILTEIVTGAKLLSNSLSTNGLLSFSLTAAAVSFSGLSVAAQASVFVSETDLGMKSYFIGKTMCAFFAFLLAALLWWVGLSS